MYLSRFSTHPSLETYLRDGRMTAPGETARDMINRIVATLATVDARLPGADTRSFARQLGEALDDRRIVFSTPIMTNAGRYTDRPLAACAVPPVDLRGDFAKVKQVVNDYHRAGMGTGFNLDNLADPVSVLGYLNDIAVEGASSGREDRPVGNMAILSLAHPRAADFITCKIGTDARGEQWKFNISLHVTDDQMRAAATGTGREYDLLQAAAEAATACADPGLLFADRMAETNPTPHLGEYVSTAPCAEVGLVAGETCQFGYLNLGRFHAPGRTRDSLPIDLELLADTVTILVRALDNAIEASLPAYPSGLSASVMTTKRKIGVGVCGLADLLLAARLPYDSDQGRDLAREIMTYINYTSKLASHQLATVRGACPAIGGLQSRYTDLAYLNRFAKPHAQTVTDNQWHDLGEQIASTGTLRNSSTIAIPPTGRSAPVIGASTGIEPLFRLTDPHTPDTLHPTARTILTQHTPELIDYATTHGHLPNTTETPAELRALLATATQISPAGHLTMAAAIQACVDEAVSKTINLPPTAQSSEVYDIFHTAWEAGCKGITVYRDQSRAVQPKAL